MTTVNLQIWSPSTVEIHVNCSNPVVMKRLNETTPSESRMNILTSSQSTFQPHSYKSNRVFSTRKDDDPYTPRSNRAIILSGRGQGGS